MHGACSGAGVLLTSYKPVRRGRLTVIKRDWIFGAWNKVGDYRCRGSNGRAAGFEPATYINVRLGRSVPADRLI